MDQECKHPSALWRKIVAKSHQGRGKAIRATNMRGDERLCPIKYGISSVKIHGSLNGGNSSSSDNQDDEEVC